MTVLKTTEQLAKELAHSPYAVTRSVDTSVRLTPFEAAMTVSEADADWQARFFSELANLMARWKRPYVFQLELVSQQPQSMLTHDARRLMSAIGDYAWNHATAEEDAR